MYLTKNYVLFYANIFNFKSVEKIPYSEIKKIEKANMAKLIPNAIAITSATSKFFFTSFTFRDAAFRFLTLLWRVAIELEISWPKEGPEAGGGAAGSSAPSSPPPQSLPPSASASAPASASASSSLAPHAQQPSGAGVMSAPTSPARPDQQQGPRKERSLSEEAESNPEGSEAEFGAPVSAAHAAVVGAAAQGGVVPAIHASTPKGAADKTSRQISELETPKPFSNETVEKMKEVVSVALPLSVAEYYHLFLDDMSSWEREFHTLKGDTEMEQTLWRESQDGCRIRDLKYRTFLNNKIGPKSTRVHEQQVLRQVSDKQILLETSVWTLDVPYGDSFCVISRFSVTYTPEYPGCWMYVSIGTSFQKSVWIKGLIEKGAFSGSKDFFAIWIKAAKQRIDTLRAEHPVMNSVIGRDHPSAAAAAAAGAEAGAAAGVAGGGGGGGGGAAPAQLAASSPGHGTMAGTPGRGSLGGGGDAHGPAGSGPSTPRAGSLLFPSGDAHHAPHSGPPPWLYWVVIAALLLLVLVLSLRERENRECSCNKAMEDFITAGEKAIQEAKRVLADKRAGREDL
jgi:hypothetical protein